MGRRQPQLVTQHLEHVSRRALEHYEKLFRDFVRRRHGIYALYRNNRLYYVGLASNLRARLAQHLRDRHAETWNRFSVYLTIGDNHLKELEVLAIRIARPKGNRTKGRFSDSENLKQRFRNAIRRSWKAEMDSIFEVGDALGLRTSHAMGQSTSGALATYGDRIRNKKIRYIYKGKQFTGRILGNGTIRFKGRLYRTPSGAAYAVSHKSVDGWHAWRYERGPGDWVRLDELRRR